VRRLLCKAVQKRDPVLEPDQHDLDPFAFASQQLAPRGQLITFASEPRELGGSSAPEAS
jgi:hypothetical protein